MGFFGSDVLAEVFVPATKFCGVVESGEGGTGGIGDAGTGHVTVEVGAEVSDEVGVLEAFRFVFVVPCPGGGGDASRKGAAADEAKVFCFADRFFDFVGFDFAASILVSDDGSEGFAFGVHGAPSGAHGGEGYGVDVLGCLAESFDRFGEGFENGLGGNFDAVAAVLGAEVSAW